MNRILSFIALLLIPIVSFGQEKDFYDLDNSHHEIFRTNNVKSLKVFTTEYDKSGAVKEKFMDLIQKFAKNGDIVWEKEFYDESSAAWEIKYTYNEHHQMILAEWTWLEEQDQDLTIYVHDANHKLVKALDYYKNTNSTEYKLQDGQIYHYKKGRLRKVTNLKNDIELRYKKKKGMVFGFSADKKLKYKYKNGDFVYKDYDSIIFRYERNNIGQFLRVMKTDQNDSVLSNTVYEYSNGLLIKTITKDSKGNLIQEREYLYEYYK